MDRLANGAGDISDRALPCRAYRPEGTHTSSFMTKASPSDFLPQAGSGRAYAIAAKLLNSSDPAIGRPWLAIALKQFKRVLDRELIDTTRSGSPSELWSRLNTQFDLDAIVSFSYAWQIWDKLTENQWPSSAWDQDLFFGKSAHSPDYHRGIKTLAQRQLGFVVPAAKNSFHTRVPLALDLGAGLGVQMSALRTENIIASAICIDTPFVADLGRIEAPEHTWIGGDLRTINTDTIPVVDLIWIGNVLHHYSRNDNSAILERFASKLSPGGTIVIQDYVLGSKGPLGLAAAALGVHFALTTSQGRDYSEHWISSLLEDAFAGCRLDFRADGKISSLLFYRNGP